MAVVVRMDQRARIQVPADLRRRLGLRPGDRVSLEVTAQGHLRVASLRDQLQAARGLFSDYRREGDRAVDELLAERRAEARREDTVDE